MCKDCADKHNNIVPEQLKSNEIDGINKNKIKKIKEKESFSLRIKEQQN